MAGSSKETREDQKPTTKKKRFVNCNSGNKDSWSLQGISIFNCLCREIKARRNTEESKKIENELRDKFKQANTLTTFRDDREPTWFEKKFEGGMAEKFECDLSGCV